MGQQGFLLSFLMVIGPTNIMAKETKASTLEEKKMKYEIVVKESNAQPALVIKGKVKVEKAGDAIGEALGKVGAYLEKKRISPTGGPFTRTFKFENGVLEFESGFPVPKGTLGNGEIISTELPKTKVATTLHTGSQDKSEEAYKAIHSWMKKNYKKEAGAPWETYLTDPATTPEPEAKLKVYFPIQ